MKLRTQFLLGSGILIVVLVTMAVLVVSTRTQLAALGSQHEIANSVQQQANDLAYAVEQLPALRRPGPEGPLGLPVRLLLARRGPPGAGDDGGRGAGGQHRG